MAVFNLFDELMEGVPVRKAVVAVLAATVMVSGCGGESGTAQPAAERWDPCSIPQDAIAATGLDANYKFVGWGDGIVLADWSRCRFQGPAVSPSYFFNVMSSEVHTIEQAQENVSNVAGADLKLGERDAYRYQTELSTSVIDCNVAVRVGSGVVVFTVDSMGTLTIGGDPCELVAKHAAELQYLLPADGN